MYERRIFVRGDYEIENLVRVADDAVIPADPDNRDYVAYERWRSRGFEEPIIRVEQELAEAEEGEP